VISHDEFETVFQAF